MATVEADTTVAIAIGGAIGALCRFGIGAVWPNPPETFPWATFAINAGGCFGIGILMVVLVEIRVPHRLLRPFLATGVLGGFTTFSTYAVDTQSLFRDGRAGLALGYLLATVASALLATWLGTLATRLLTRTHHGRPR